MVIGIMKFLLRSLVPTKHQADKQVGGYTMALLNILPVILGLDSLNKQLTGVITVL